MHNQTNQNFINLILSDLIKNIFIIFYDLFIDNNYFWIKLLKS